MLTTRGWGGAGGLVSVQGFGGFFVEAKLRSRGFSGDFLELFIDLRHKQRIKQGLVALQNRIAVKDLELTETTSTLTDLERQLRDLQTQTRILQRQRRIP